MPLLVNLSKLQCWKKVSTGSFLSKSGSICKFSFVIPISVRINTIKFCRKSLKVFHKLTYLNVWKGTNNSTQQWKNILGVSCMLDFQESNLELILDQNLKFFSPAAHVCVLTNVSWSVFSLHHIASITFFNHEHLIYSSVLMLMGQWQLVHFQSINWC